MPATYAHYRFGQDCMDLLPEKLRMACLEYEDLYNFGVHGPDIFFYYHPLSKNMVNEFGCDLHEKSGREFFMSAIENYREHGNKKAMMAYLLGFLAHFTLDSCAHAYINQRTEKSVYSHNYIEAQYETYLMMKDGREPVRVNRGDSLKPSHFVAHVIASFFDFSPSTILKTLRGQKLVMWVLYSPREWKKRFLRFMIRELNVGESFGDLFIDSFINSDCIKSNLKIEEFQEEALQLYPKLAKNFVRTLYGKEELGEHFDFNFEGIKINIEENKE